MPDRARFDLPLASYVLRVRGRPATLRFELHDLRTGERHVFVQADRLARFLREHGLAAPAVDATPGAADPKDASA